MAPYIELDPSESELVLRHTKSSCRLGTPLRSSMEKNPGCSIGVTWNFGWTWGSSCEGRACGAEATSSSTGIFLGLPCLLHGGITFIKEDSCLESKSYYAVHNNDNLYPLDLFKN